MPFQSTSPADPLPSGDPAVRIFFHGLLLLRASSDRKFCVVETHLNAGYPHTLSIEVRTKSPNEPDVIHMRHFGPLEPPDPGLTIEFDPAPGFPLVYKYQPSPIFDPVLDYGSPDDFRWIVDLEKLHGKTLLVDTTKTRPGITIGNGFYYFYSAQRMIGPIGVTQGGVNKPPYAAIASIVGAQVFLDNQSALVLKWRENGHNRKLLLQKPLPRVSHEIYIDNSPLYEDPTAGATHTELTEYYRVIPGIPPNEQFNMTFPMRDNSLPPLEGSAKFGTLQGSARIPCQSIVLEGS